jgi:Rod binding domain-containing protein
MTGIPPVDQSLLPADVRNGTDKQKQAYTAAVGFERMLIERLTKPLAQSALGTGDDTGSDDGSTDGSGANVDSGSSVYSDMISSSLADSVSQQGGLGLADSLYRSFGASS